MNNTNEITTVIFYGFMNNQIKYNTFQHHQIYVNLMI